MTRAIARGPLGLVCRRCLSSCVWPAAAAALLALLANWRWPQELGDEVASGAASPWLVLPLCTVAMTSALVAAAFWPTFAARRPGADWIVRLQGGPWRGAGGAVAGAVLAQLLWSLLLLQLLPPALGVPAQARAHVALQPPGEGELATGGAPLRLAVPPDLDFDELHVRPLAGLPRGAIEPTRVEVRADGELLIEQPLVFSQSRQLARAAFRARRCKELQLVATAGTLPLWLPHGSVIAVATGLHPRWQNAAWLALVAAVPAFVALAVACLCGVAASLPTVLTVAASLVFVQMVGDFGPFAHAVRTLARGQWLPASGVFPACVPSLAVACVAMILAMLGPTRLRR
jgi:hypothetical protein